MSKTAAERQRDKRKRDTVTPQNVTDVTLEPKRDIPLDRTRLVPIPGDADYDGCCHEVGGEWKVDSIKPDIQAMSTDELIRRLHYIKDWQQSDEHGEIQRRRMVDVGAQAICEHLNL